jgi:uncharacterized Zn-binding protein involved in type VI secretion
MEVDMKHEGRGVIRIGDKTSHGGQVISASSGTVVMGKLAALDGDMSVCPQCKGKFALKPDGGGAKHEGKSYAYHDDLTECGARLISSLSPSGGAEVCDEEVQREGLCDSGFDDRFVLLSEAGVPASFVEYAIERENGKIECGMTNEKGETHLLSQTTKPEQIRVYVANDI